ncbi:helix-turn-helix transcriptional regulator [Streptomyces sp. BE20]|uniref:helix-turn-helix domain-containing protein n=1 Tax=Streptomycetaceae TaxID=2062 RepID=UPI002E7A064F|nr:MULTISPECIES: helix-turn-helix transcriptional regulator [unclassified Streptomyces]MED7950793.1 helix-turn-helix transcriptional regulator [Streptomyces sp. BE303]MEE1826159.1 helix-turn-helix transcriptional regulator [Streptomyces sp. BE20]
MALRSNPTLRQRRLGAELRRMREQAGLGGSQLARILGISPAQVNQMEMAKIGVSPERLRLVASACNCANESLIDVLAHMATERGKGWWEEFRGVLTTDFLEVAELEAHATRLTFCTTAYMPGLLQTSAYASAVFARLFPPLSSHEIDTRTAFRIRRQEIVRSGATPLRTFIHEAALRMQFGGPKVLVEQLGALLADAERPGISVRVVPFTVDTFPGAGENLTFAEGSIPELDTIEIDVSQGALFLDSPADLANHRAIFSRLDSTALAEDESREFILAVMKEVKPTNV